ncbi:reprolysin-like metallopeptidase [Aridibaculum aurantiacum]|uniref:reprolysin-like metallopeptidase n=1 Tax=Aridibaculum aurantiacum TaxID=2810307 RepID=UPI001A966655|nr:zinc-dependent metalloprotease family protein [Aridibaculum aurantiacum]
MRKFLQHVSLLLLATCLGPTLFAQNNFFNDVAESRISVAAQDRKIIPQQYRTIQLDTTALKSFLARAPQEFTPAVHGNIISIPMPDGTSQRFTLAEASIMEPALAAKYPNIRTYGGQGIDDPYATIKLDWTPLGFHGMILSPVGGSVYIDPYAFNNNSFYISYYKKDIAPRQGLIEPEEITGFSGDAPPVHRTEGRCIGGTLRTYRMAIACTGEYARAVGGASVTVAQALSAIVITANRVNGVYEKELSIRLTLVGNNDQIVYTDPLTDPFTGNSNASILIQESQTVITANILPANYDIGHTFSTGGGGLASLRCVCNDTQKARGITGSAVPLGDPYDIDYVAHEIGHQFGGNHTFNATTGSCSGGNRNSTTAVEPGSGSTIQAYAGICGTNNLQLNSDAMFHAISFNEMTAFSIDGTGNSCAGQITTGNNPPTANAGADYIIPKSTPFMLTGSGSDPNGDALTYCWEQIDVGPAGDWNNPTGNAPLFRSFLPVTSPTRTFPKIGDIVTNATTIGEILPSYARNINFRLTVRDNRSGGGGVCSDESMVTVDGTAGPFVVTAPNAAMNVQGGSFYNVRWDVAGTNVAPINTSDVVIELSTDGGFTYPTTLVASTPNDGSHEVVIPNINTTTARVRVRAVGNIFFDISNANFTISQNPSSEFIFNEPAPVQSCAGSNLSSTLLTNAVNGFSTPVTLSASGNPAGTTVAFSSNPVAPGSPVTVSLQGTLANGTYHVQVTGTAGSVIKTRTIMFIVGPPSGASMSNTPPNNSTGIAVTPTFTWSAVPGVTTYNLQVATENTFTSGLIHNINNINSASYTLTAPLAQNTIYYWRVAGSNTCGNGPFSSTTLFKTGLTECPTDTAYSADVPKVISAITTGTVQSTLQINSAGTIADVDVVGVRGLHTYMADLSFSITSPMGTTVALMAGQCGSQDNFDLHFNDAGPAGPYNCPPINGQVRRPTQPLSAFNNQNPNGTWRLSVTDGFADDGGVLNSWGLRICTFYATPLPVNWLTFSAQKAAGNTVTVMWQTASEMNNSHYEVERTHDGNSFHVIGTIAAGNNPATTNQYLFNDMKPFSGANYYRLKQVDKDGKFTYTKVVRVVMETKQALWVLYPNPAVEVSSVRATSDMKEVSVRITDALGKLVLLKLPGVVKAGEVIELPVKGFAKGMYTVNITSDKGTSNEKLLVQ